MKKTMHNILSSGMMAAVVMGSVALSSCEKQLDDVSPAGVAADANARHGNNAATRTYVANLSELNHSGASGTATLTLQGNMLTVEIMATGLEPNMVHAQHIHGFTDNKGNAICPPMSADTNNDGLIDLVEGLPFYGPVLLPLTPFPTADANGEVNFTMTYTLGQNSTISVSDLMPLQNRAIVLHGLTVDGTYMATLPVACGQIKSQPKGGQ